MKEMKNDYDIKEDLISHIKLNPLFETTRINVQVKNGVVTLFGSVENYFEKLTAEQTAKKIEGVTKVVNNISVRIHHGYEIKDTDIAKSAIEAFKLYTFLSPDKIRIKVEDGVIKLYGEVEDDFQRELASLVIAALPGVRDVYNFIQIPIDLEQGISRVRTVES
jgi:osmotically-inducible protein OsmY